MNSISRTHSVSRERGAALVIALLMLLVLTVLGIAAMNVTRLEERMAGNSRDINLAFQGAEAGLRDSEERIRLMASRPGNCSVAPCTVWSRDMPPIDLRNLPLSWWETNAREYGIAGAQEIAEVTRDPLIVTESLGFVPDSLSVGHGPPEGRDFYKITSNSSGASDTANAVLETTYTRRF